MTSYDTIASQRKTAVLVGVLFIVGTTAGVLSGLLILPLIEAPGNVMVLAANETQVYLGALLVLVMGFALTMVPVVLFPVLRPYGEPLALGAIVFRGALEAVCYMGLVLVYTLLLTASKAATAATAVESAALERTEALLLAANAGIEQLLAIVFCLGALMIYALFYRSQLVPRWLSIWGLLGAVLYLVAPLVSMIGRQHYAISFASPLAFLIAPLAIQEMVFAVWLIVKGFTVPESVLALA